jgi:hypothetical protein
MIMSHSNKIKRVKIFAAITFFSAVFAASFPGGKEIHQKLLEVIHYDSFSSELATATIS